jgi:hypothetical protein
MPKPFHQMVWIDYRLARLYGVTRDGLSELAVIHAPDEGRGNIHHKAGAVGPGHVAVSPGFLIEVAAALQEAQEVLIVGPADAKHALKKYIATNLPQLDKLVVGVEPMDKCDQGNLQSFASLFFRQVDRMHSSTR